jgi:hypothetical protein
MSDTAAERAHVERLLQITRRNLQRLETQAFQHGGYDAAPLHIANQIDSTKEQIAELESRLVKLGGMPAPAATEGSGTSPAPTQGGGSTGISLGQGNTTGNVTISVGGGVAGGNIVGGGGGSSTPVAPTVPRPAPRPSGQEVTLRFDRQGKSARIAWNANMLGNKRTSFRSPYDEATLRLVNKALDAVQYPGHPDEGPEFSDGERSILANLGIWQGDRVAPTAYKTVGQAIYRALGREGQAALKAVVNYGIVEGKTTSYVLRFPEDGVQMAALPWELLADKNKPILLMRGNDIDSCERYMDIDQALPPPRPAGEQFQILALSPGYEIPDDVRQAERAAREASWNKLRDAGRISYHELTPLTRRALTDYLRKQPRPPDIVHYFGHGIYQDGEGYLVFDNVQGGMDLVSAGELAAILGEVRLVVIHACQSATVEAQGGLLSGVAPALSLVVGAVVAMQFTVRIDAATRFAEVFYDELLGSGHSLQAAVAEARQTLLFDFGRDANWYVPTLYIRSREQKPVFLLE